MTPKQLKWWESEFLAACGLACLYQCSLSIEQFCAARGLETEEKEALETYLHQHNICN